MTAKARPVARALRLEAHALFAGLGHAVLPTLQKFMAERLSRRLP